MALLYDLPLICGNCRYSLRHLSLSAACPERGEARDGTTLVLAAIHHADPASFRRFTTWIIILAFGAVLNVLAAVTHDENLFLPIVLLMGAAAVAVEVARSVRVRIRMKDGDLPRMLRLSPSGSSIWWRGHWRPTRKPAGEGPPELHGELWKLGEYLLMLTPAEVERLECVLKSWQQPAGQPGHAQLSLPEP